MTVCLALRPAQAGRDAWLRSGAAIAAGLVLALQLLVPWAWDRDRMLAAARHHDAETVAVVQALQQTIVGALGQPESLRLQAVNGFFNQRVRFLDDRQNSGQVDQWASPVELLARGTGDCEDYATAKYFSLIAAGVPAARLRMVYVRADLGGSVQAHMVLAYYLQPDAEPLILDNLHGEIQPASQRRDLTPVFSFNAEGLWQGTRGPAAGDAAARLSRWRELLGKARTEGFL